MSRRIDHHTKYCSRFQVFCRAIWVKSALYKRVASCLEKVTGGQPSFHPEEERSHIPLFSVLKQRKKFPVSP